MTDEADEIRKCVLALAALALALARPLEPSQSESCATVDARGAPDISWVQLPLPFVWDRRAAGDGADP